MTNFDGLGYCKFKKLNQLLLYDNQITQIGTLENCDFSKLKVLCIHYNTVEAFPKMNLANLRFYWLYIIIR